MRKPQPPTNGEIQDAAYALISAYNTNNPSFIKPEHLGIIIDLLINSGAIREPEFSQINNDLMSGIIKFGPNQQIPFSFAGCFDGRE